MVVTCKYSLSSNLLALSTMATSITSLASMNSSSMVVPSRMTQLNSQSSLVSPISSLDTLQFQQIVFLAKAKPICRRYRSRCSLNDGLAGVKKKDFLDPSLEVKNKAADISSELKGTSIFLVGMNSTIKTKLGNALADALRYYYFDSDSLVEQAAGGESTGKSFRERDEKGFLDSESEVLKQLSSMGRLVVCVGDGAVKSSTNLGLLRHGISIWIDIPIHILAREARESGRSTSTSELTAVYERMKDGCAIADATVSLQKVASQLGYDDMDEVIIEDMTVEALKEIEKLTRVKKMMEAAARPF